MRRQKRRPWKEKWARNFNEKATIVRNVYQVKKCEHLYVSAGICTITSEQGSYKEKWAINFNEKATIVRNSIQVKKYDHIYVP